jgi:hypothetical protein
VYKHGFNSSGKLAGSLLVYCSVKLRLECNTFLLSNVFVKFLSFNNSNVQKVQLTYDFTFTNGDKLFRIHFSADEFGIFETSITFTIVYFLLILLTCAYATILYNKKFFHLTFQLFLASVVIQFVSFLFFMSEYAQFAYSGQFTPGMLTTGL